MLRDEASIPVVEVKMSVYDILMSIKMAENYTDKFAIIGYSNITKCAKSLCTLLKYNWDIVTIDRSTDIKKLLLSMKAQDYGMIICDMVTSRMAGDMGLNCILITSGIESIETAFDEAIELENSFKAIKAEKSLITNALRKFDEKLIIYDRNKSVRFSSFNIGSDNKELFGIINAAWDKFLNNSEYELIKKQKDTCIAIKSRSFHNCGEAMLALYISEKRLNYLLDDASVDFYNRQELFDSEFTWYYNTSSYVGDLRKTIESYSATSFPIFILGEIGTGKDKAAHIIYENGSYKNKPLCIIDCSLINERRFTSLLTSDASPLNDVHSTIYFKNIGDLKPAQAQDLFQMIEQTKMTARNRLIFSFITSEENNEDSPICCYLMNNMSCLTLRLQPLRERAADIPSISALYINQLNTMLGKQIIGFEDEAMELLKKFAWQHNLDQFKRIVKELFILTDSYYIGTDAVGKALKREAVKSKAHQSLSAGGINIHQPMHQINYEIIQALMNEDGMNQEKISKMLGVSRSTIWRIIKNHE